MTVLVTGGAGYIGSHMVACLRDAGRDVVVADDLSSGHAEHVPADVQLIVTDVADRATIGAALRDHHVDAIVHFAARIQVGESVTDPRKYWMGNFVATAQLLESALDHGVGVFVFSSSAAVYGGSHVEPIAESAELAPVNPYGDTKLAVERMLASYERAYGVRWAALRYFNAAGACVARGLGEMHDPETHLIPLVLDVALGRREHVTIYGDDYDTPDGTCIRDYVHVCDLADAHLAALEYLSAGGASGAMNLGSGAGHSVLEVVEACRAATGGRIPVARGPRRTGDPPKLVASPTLARERLRWRADRSSLQRIVADAWAARRQATTAPPRRRKDQHAHAR